MNAEQLNAEIERLDAVGVELKLACPEIRTLGFEIKDVPIDLMKSHETHHLKIEQGYYTNADRVHLNVFGKSRKFPIVLTSKSLEITPAAYKEVER